MWCLLLPNADQLRCFLAAHLEGLHRLVDQQASPHLSIAVVNLVKPQPVGPQPLVGSIYLAI